MYTGQAAAIKEGPFIGYSNADGRGGFEVSNGHNNTGTIDAAFSASYSGDVQGIAATQIGNITNEWTDDHEYDTLEYYEGWDDLNGIPHLALRVWRKLATDNISAFTRIGPLLRGVIGNSQDAPLISRLMFTTLNFNQSSKTDQYYYCPGWAVWNADNPNSDGSDDPFGVLANEPPATLVTSGLVLQLAADAGTSTTTDSTPLASWTDQSSTGTVFSQSSSSLQPTYTTNALNGLPVVACDGSQSLAAPGVVSALNTTNTTAFVVAAVGGGSGTIRTVFGNDSPTTGQGWGLCVDNTNVWAFGYGTGSSTVELTGSAYGPFAQQITGIFDQSATDKQVIRVDGVPVNTAASGYSPQSSQAPAVGIENSLGLYNWNGAIAEILVYNRALSASEISQNENYLLGKWTGHP